MSLKGIVSQRLIEVFVSSLLVASAFASYFILSGVLPTVMQDELVYRENSRLGVLDFELPNYLYFRLFSLADLLGENFYLAVKATNTFFHLASALLLLYWRRASSDIFLRSAASILYFWSPFVGFTSFFMPESLYAFLILISLIWFINAIEKPQNLGRQQLVLVGVALALAQLVKPHGLFFLAGFVLYLLLGKHAESGQVSLKIKAALVLVASFTLVRLVVGFFAAGVQTFNLSGSYTEGVEDVLNTRVFEDYLGFLLGVFVNFGQHLLTLSIFLAPIVFSFIADRWRLSREFWVVLTTMLTVAFFIASFESYITHIVGDNHLERILLRHYEFLIPVLWLTFWRILQGNQAESERPFGRALAQFAFAMGFVGIALTEGVIWSVSNYSDSGYTHGLGETSARWAMAGLWLVLFVVLSLKKVLSREKVIAGTVFVVAAISSVSGISGILEQNTEPLPSDLAGIYVREQFPEVSGEEILVFGSDRPLTQASVFQMNKQGIDYKILIRGSSVMPESIPDTVRLVVAFGDISLEDLEGDIFEGDGFQLYLAPEKQKAP